MRFSLALPVLLFCGSAGTGYSRPTYRALSEALPKGLMGAPKDAEETYQKSFQKSGSKSFTLKQKNNDDGADEVKALKFKTSVRKSAPPMEVMTDLESQDIKLKKDSGDNDRRLTVSNGKPAGFVADVVAPIKLRNLLRGKIEVSKKQAGGTDKDFMADVAAPIELENKLAREAPGSNRRLQQAECFVQTDGTLACVVKDFPADGFYTVYLNCPTDVTSVFECSSCGILASSGGELDPANDPLCLSCSVCSDTTAFDCSNLGEGTCTKRDCNGNCSGSDPSSAPVPSPTPAPTPAPVSSPTSSGGGVTCQNDQNGRLFCARFDYPGDGYITVFQDCPATTTNALQCGRCDIVAPDDTPFEIDLVNDAQCSSCTVCSNRAAYDCSNLDRGSCSVYDCDGNCSGPQPNPTAAPVAPTTAPVSPTVTPVSPTPAPVNPTAGTVAPSRPPSGPTFSFPVPNTGSPASSASVKDMGVFSFSAVALGLLFVAFF